LEECLSLGAKEVIETVEGATVFGGVHDLVAFGEEGIEAFDEHVANAGSRSEGIHKYVCVKVTQVNTNILLYPN